MVTESTISYTLPDGSIRQVYAQCDEPIAGMRTIILENYTTQEQVVELVELGDISALGKDIASTVFRERDLNETGKEPHAYPSVAAYLQSSRRREYDFLFQDGEWFLRYGVAKLRDLNVVNNQLARVLRRK